MRDWALRARRDAAANRLYGSLFPAIIEPEYTALNTSKTESLTDLKLENLKRTNPVMYANRSTTNVSIRGLDLIGTYSSGKDIHCEMD